MHHLPHPEKSSLRQSGYTLIELMIAVIILAILASIAVVSYRSHVIKSNRAAAESFMLQIANREEQYMLDARAYTGTIGSGGLNLPTPGNVSTNYNISITPNNSATPPSYVITATPIDPPQSDAMCGILTLDQTGNKGSSAGSVQTCWN